MNPGTPGSRVVVLTELRVLFEERAIPAPTANRIVPRRPPRATPRALGGAMNHLPHSPRASDLMRRAPMSGPLISASHAHLGSSLGSASAAPIWAWSGVGSAARRAFAPPPSVAVSAAVPATRPMPPRRDPAPAPSPASAPTPPRADDAPRAVHIPGEVLRAMAATAARTGRRESELWAEAAREWLDRQANHDDPPPAAALAPTSALRATRERCWSAIDILLSDLRAPDRAPMPAMPAMPAAARSTDWDGWDGWDGSAA
jgi:hypothetical protein